MSVKVMSAVWEREDLDASERLVLLSLADHADDDGVCYPSIARLCKRTSLAERTVQGTVKRLTQRGLLVVEYGGGRNGTNRFTVRANPAADAPPQQMHPRRKCATPPQMTAKNPAADAPKPSRTTIEPSNNVRAVLCAVLKPETADAFIEHRAAKRAKLTARAAELIVKKLAGHTAPDAVVEHSIMNGWTGVFPESVPAATGWKPDLSKYGVQ